MAKIHSLKEFKDVRKARMYRTHLLAILKVVNLSINGLKHFEVYSSVQEILRTLKNEKRVLESHLTKMEKFLKERDHNEQNKK